MELLKVSNPELYNKMISIENHTNQYVRKRRETIHIPVVVHVVYHNTEQNISDDQIKSQIDVLNEDFRRTNADRINTPAPFASVAVDMNIQFELAVIDSKGNLTNGITRNYTYITWGDDMGGCNGTDYPQINPIGLLENLIFR